MRPERLADRHWTNWTWAIGLMAARPENIDRESASDSQGALRLINPTASHSKSDRSIN